MQSAPSRRDGLRAPGGYAGGFSVAGVGGCRRSSGLVTARNRLVASLGETRRQCGKSPGDKWKGLRASIPWVLHLPRCHNGCIPAC